MQILCSSHSHPFSASEQRTSNANELNYQKFPKKDEESQVQNKICQFRVQMRKKQTNEYKNNIRQQMLRVRIIEDLLEKQPFNNEQMHYWATQLVHAYSASYKYQLTEDKVVDIFKKVQRFPNKLTLQLLEIVVIRADLKTVNMVFQYDIMRLLHNFINVAGKIEPGNIPKRSSSPEDREIINEAVISTNIETVEHSLSQSTTYMDMLELARIVIRIIAELCKKATHIRNFAILNHKTYTYCLKAYKCFGKDIDIQFFMFLQAATVYGFGRLGEAQFERITAKAIRLFYEEKFNIKIELQFDKDGRHYLRGYQYLVTAIKNLLAMNSKQIHLKILQSKDQQYLILNMISSILTQCNYVMDYPSLTANRQELLPIKLYEATLELAMYAIEALQTEYEIISTPILNMIYYEVLKFIRRKDLGIGFMDFTQARRSSYFLLANFFYDEKDENVLQNFIMLNVTDAQDNLINLIAYMLENQSSNENKSELGLLLKSIFENLPVNMIEPLLIPSDIFRIMLQNVLQIRIWRDDYNEISTAQTAKNTFINAILAFFEYMGPYINQKILYYKGLILDQYSYKIQAFVSLPNRNSLIQSIKRLYYRAQQIPIY